QYEDSVNITAKSLEFQVGSSWLRPGSMKPFHPPYPPPDPSTGLTSPTYAKGWGCGTHPCPLPPFFVSDELFVSHCFVRARLIRPLGRMNDSVHNEAHTLAVYLPDLSRGN